MISSSIPYIQPRGLLFHYILAVDKFRIHPRDTTLPSSPGMSLIYLLCTCALYNLNRSSLSTLSITLPHHTDTAFCWIGIWHRLVDIVYLWNVEGRATFGLWLNRGWFWWQLCHVKLWFPRPDPLSPKVSIISSQDPPLSSVVSSTIARLTWNEYPIGSTSDMDPYTTFRFYSSA